MDMSKVKNYFIDLGSSIIKTKSLFKFAFYKWFTPLVIFILATAAMIVPNIIAYNSLTIDNITSNTLFIDQALVEMLKDDIKCSIKDEKLVCDEDYSYRSLKTVQDENTIATYSIYVNYNVADEGFEVGEYGEHFDTDNYLIFFENYFVYRYTTHNPKDKTVSEAISFGMYTQLDGLDFHKIYENSLTSEDSNKYLLEQSNSILLDGYKSYAKEGVFTATASNAGIYILFILVISLLMKGNYLLKSKKGFKFTQAMKISIVSSLQSLLIAVILSLFGISFVNAFGLSLAARSIYIYIRYTGSSKNKEWLQELYIMSNEERFNV